MLQYQSYTLGLFPRGKSGHARVRDNVYCVSALWAFSMAYRYILYMYMHYKCSQRPGILRSQGMYCKSCLRVMQAPSYVVCNCSPHVHVDMLVMIRVVPTNWSKVLSSACEAFSSAT